MNAPSLPAPGAASRRSRRSRRLGGLNGTVLMLEIRRLLRSRRTVILAVFSPVAFFLVFGLNQAYANEAAGHGNVSAFLMTSMALYGAVLATTSGGAMVSIERAAGWTRQLRLTPLSAAAYIGI
jgi:ABC-2 type transport system permease protein